MTNEASCRNRADRACRLLIAATAALAITISSGTLSLGQNNKPPKSAKGPARADSRDYPAKAYVERDVSTVEDELAQYMQFRGEVGAEGAARLELLIDLRVVSRWLLTGAAAAQPESELQITSTLRGWDVLAATQTLAEVFKNSPKPTQPQLDAMAKLHALTFKLEPLKDVRQADEVCRDLGMLLAGAIGPLPPEVKQIPLMRPGRTPSPAASTGSPVAPSVELDSMTRLAALNVAPPLKKQLVALVTATTEAEQKATKDPKKSDDAASLKAMTRDLLTIAEGLSRNTGVDPAARPRLEQLLADGLALYVDPRTRSLGQSRISQLDGYARMLGRVRKMNLKPDLLQRLAPAFAWAQEHADAGAKLVQTIEAYLGACERADARAALDAAGSSGLGAREQKAIAESVKTVALEREMFLNEAGNLSRPGVTADIGGFNQHVDSIRSALDSIETFEKTPKALATLLATRPKPTGGLERRVAQALSTLTETKSTGNRDEAHRTLLMLVTLADLAIDADAAGPVPPDVAQLYTRGKLPAFDARRKEMIAELASVLASGKEVDPLRVERLEQMRDVRAMLGDIAQFELAAKRSDLLSRWADWPVTLADLQVVVTPFRESVASAIELLSGADNSMSATWQATRARYRPIMRAAIKAAQYADLCTGLPAGWPGHVGRLVTPNDNQPFSAERYTAFSLLLWARLEKVGDPKSAAIVADALTVRLRGSR